MSKWTTLTREKSDNATYLGSKFVANEEAVFDLDGTNHILRQAHHHLLLLQLLGLQHGLLLAVQLLLVSNLIRLSLSVGLLL